MRVLDTGVIVAAFASWHEAHDASRAELRKQPRVAAHSLVEAYSVLTRLPAAHRVPAELAARFLDLAFPADALSLDPPQVRPLVTARLPVLGISGGAVYDAVIAETVRLAGGTLVTLDRRALSTYERIGCPAELLYG
ncbi:MAG TPA: PIN domain-containing protein [Arachnia sp.]|nr:PIN domain-containing protein [Arachnia sp.]HMT86910.1 PIN domain-containing protein [Arachnia sp.]